MVSKWTIRSLGLFALLAALAIAGLAQAQPLDPDRSPYAVHGQVTQPDGDPATEAYVWLVPHDDTDADRRSTQIGAQGTYRFTDVPEGRYYAVADAACCGPTHRTLTVAGPEPTHQVDLTLSDGGLEANHTRVLVGELRTLDGDPVPGAELTLRYDASEERHEERELTTTADENGTYIVEAPEDHLELEATAKGHDITRGSAPTVPGAHELTIPLRASQVDSATVQGQVLSDDQPAEDAHVEARPADECGSDPCVSRAPPQTRVERDDASFYIESRAQRHASASTGEDGRFELTVQTGEMQFEARADEHVPSTRTLELEAGENRSLTMRLAPIPPDNVQIEGTVQAADDADPIPHAQVRLVNQAYGSFERIRTDGDGRFEATIKPGYTLVEVRAGSSYRVPCEDEPSDDEEATAQRSGTSEASVARSPAIARPICTEDRDETYYPRSLVLVPHPNESRTLDVESTPRPEPTATIEGWAVNASSEEGVENARVVVVNEATRERGKARADADGSFSIDVRAGYYTIRAQHGDYYTAVDNLAVDRDGTGRVALEMHPGTPSRGHCCGVEPISVGTTAEGEPDRAQQASAVGEIEPRQQGAAVFEGSGGGLGPYDASKLDEASATDDEQATPAPAFLVVLVATILAGLRRR